MKTPKKKEVIKYFENAKEVESHLSQVFILKHKISKDGNCFRSGCFIVWSPIEGYAKILSYKKPFGYFKSDILEEIEKAALNKNPFHVHGVKYIPEPKEETLTITKEQIKEIYGRSKPYGEIERKLKEWFPEVFEEAKKELFSKPTLSLNDLLSVWGDINDIELYKTAPLFKSFEDLAEAKLKEIGVNAKIV